MRNHIPLPGNTEAEEQILACVLYNPRLIVRVSGRLKAEHFASPDLGNIYDCMLSLLAQKKEPTDFNVASELAKRNKRTDDIRVVRQEIKDIRERFAIDGRIDEYIDEIIETSRYRRLIAFGTKLVAGGYEQDKTIASQAMEQLSKILSDGDLREMAPFSQILDEYMAKYDQARKDHAEGKIVGLSTGFKSIDRFFRFFPGDLDILAARTSIGKTSFALNVALSIAKESLLSGIEVAFFSLEMSRDQLAQRLLSTDSLLDQSLLRDGKTTDDEDLLVRRKAQELRPIGLHISDRDRHIDEIKNSARLICERRTIGLIVVDYLQLIRSADGGSSRQPRHEVIAEISRELKGLAQELHVPILALAQLNRESEKQNEPQLTNLGESDAIGRDADTVSFIHILSEEIEKRNRAEDYQVVFKVRKNRQGSLGEVSLGFRPRQTRFIDILEEY